MPNEHLARQLLAHYYRSSSDTKEMIPDDNFKSFMQNILNKYHIQVSHAWRIMPQRGIRGISKFIVTLESENKIMSIILNLELQHLLNDKLLLDHFYHTLHALHTDENDGTEYAHYGIKVDQDTIQQFLEAVKT